ncbi:NAD(P)-dependent oxidoreductase [Dyella flava]|uniref:NAD(P)-dependent oxidoreductase n=1 Tax=Dyella flava TaxID=1920170 RepID=A0ABS2KAD5_9GAMM|nr:NAD(P)-dependent oxidoreductase [Dyella flava]MBM7127283.1 NAD(P)-dependent oxidoreductase [Dyella flava]GLQ52134.1 NAD-dependent dehydratase [Dyella flava]
MKLVLFGATGHIGHAILDEALARGHDITAVVRDASRLTEQHHKLHVVVGDIADPASWLAAAKGADAVIASVSARRNGNSETIPNAANTLLACLPDAGVERLLWVGGAGSLETSPGVRVIDDPHFPEAWKPEAQAQARALEIFRSSKADIDWTYISPAAWLEDGARTGTYRMGGDALLTDASGHSRISVPDYAVALLDRLDREDAPRQRITVAY